MSHGDSKRLEECEYLNDNIIDFRIKHYMLEMLSSPLQIYAFSCQFYSRLIQGKDHAEGYRLVSSWTKSFDLFSKHFVYVPVNLNAHWSLSIIVRPDLITCKVRLVLCVHSSSGNFEQERQLTDANRSCLIFMDSLGLHRPSTIYKRLLRFVPSLYGYIAYALG